MELRITFPLLEEAWTKRSAAAVDAGVAYAVRGIVFKEDQIAFLKVAYGSHIAPGTHGGETGCAVTARADAAGAKAEIHESGAVETLGGAFLGPNVRITEHSGCNGDQPVRAVRSVIGRFAVREGNVRRSELSVGAEVSVLEELPVGLGVDVEPGFFVAVGFFVTFGVGEGVGVGSIFGRASGE